jgi:hypothetical protein
VGVDTTNAIYKKIVKKKIYKKKLRMFEAEELEG